VRALLFVLHTAVVTDGRWCCWRRNGAFNVYDAIAAR